MRLLLTLLLALALTSPSSAQEFSVKGSKSLKSGPLEAAFPKAASQALETEEVQGFLAVAKKLDSWLKAHPDERAALRQFAPDAKPQDCFYGPFRRAKSLGLWSATGISYEAAMAFLAKAYACSLVETTLKAERAAAASRLAKLEALTRRANKVDRAAFELLLIDGRLQSLLLDALPEASIVVWKKHRAQLMPMLKGLDLGFDFVGSGGK